MKIVINSASSRLGGGFTYISHLLRNLPAEAEYVFIAFLPPETIAKQENLSPNVILIPTEIMRAGLLRRIWWEQVTLRRFVRRERADALYSSADFAMFRCPVRQVLLLQNASYSSNLYAERFLPLQSWQTRLAGRVRRWLRRQSIKWANVVLTPTEAMLAEVRGEIEISSSKALVNPYGNPSQADAASADVSASNGIVRLLFVSLYSEHKNLPTLLKGMAVLNAAGTIRFQLKTTADPGWHESTRISTYQQDLQLARRSDIAACVQFVGPFNHEQTQELYRAADVFVFPSVVESFGFPMLEAMNHGIPIVAADTAVNREVCGESAIYFRPFDPDDLARQIRRVADDVALRRVLAETGRGRARQFRWDVHVSRLLASALPFAKAQTDASSSAGRDDRTVYAETGGH